MEAIQFGQVGVERGISFVDEVAHEIERILEALVEHGAAGCVEINAVLRADKSVKENQPAPHRFDDARLRLFVRHPLLQLPAQIEHDVPRPFVHVLHIILHIELRGVLLYQRSIDVGDNLTVIAGQKILRRVFGIGTVLILPELHHCGLVIVGIEQAVLFGLFHILFQIIQQALIGKAGNVCVRNPNDVEVGARRNRLRDPGFVCSQLCELKIHVRIDDVEPCGEFVHQFLLLRGIEHRHAKRRADFGVNVAGNIVVRIFQIHPDRAGGQAEYPRHKQR